MSRSSVNSLFRTALTLSIALAVFTTSTPVLAQSNLPFDTSRAPTDQGGAVPTAVNLDSCFLYYTFGSTPVVLTAELASVAIGVPFNVKGSVTNANAYPIVDATVYVKVMRQRSVEKDVNGPDIVDFIPVLEHANIQAGQTIPFSFTWNVPKDADVGAYRMAAYVVEKERFNFLGLSFTDDVTGGFYQFNVVGNTPGTTRFNKDSATVNGTRYYFAAFPPTLRPEIASAEVMIDVENTSKNAYTGSVTWKLYYWDSLRTEHLLDEETVAIEVPAGGTVPVSFTIPDTTHSVYYLVGELETPGGSKSIAGIRVARADENTPRINSMNVTAYPTTEDTKAFTCFHNAGHGEAANTKVEMWVKEPLLFGLIGLPIAHEVYTGVAPKNIVALTMPAGKAGLSSFDLVATVSQDGKVIDKIKIPYRCDQLGATCSWPSLIDMALMVMITLVLVGIGVLIYMRTRPRPHVPTPLVPPSI